MLQSSQKKIALYLTLLVFFIDLLGIGLVYPLFSCMIFQPGQTILPSCTSNMVKGIYLGILLALMPLVQFFSAPFFGFLSDRRGRKKLLLLTLVFGIIGYIVAILGVYLKSIWILIFSRILVGIGTGNESIANAIVADISTSENKSKNFGLLYMAAGFGSMIGPYLGSRLSETNLFSMENYVMPFLFATLLTLINLILALFFFKETYFPVKSNLQTFSFSLGFSNLKRAYRDTHLNILFLSIWFYYFAWTFYYQFLSVFLIQTQNFTTKNIGNFYAYGAFFYALSTGFLIRPIMNRYKYEKILYYSLILCSISIAIMLIFFNPILLLIYFPIQQYLVALIFPTTSIIISNKVSCDVQGEMMGLAQSVQSLALVLSPVIGGLLIGFSSKVAMIVSSMTMFIGAIILKKFIGIQKLVK